MWGFKTALHPWAPVRTGHIKVEKLNSSDYAQRVMDAVFSRTSLWINAFKLWPAVFKRAWPWFILTFLGGLGFDMAVEMIKKIDERLALMAGLAAVMIALFFGALTTIIISQVVSDSFKQTKSSLTLALQNNFKHVLIESTRSLVPIILKFLLLIIPGLIEIVRLFFITYIVQFDTDYKVGKVDALDRSRELVRGSFGFAAFVIVLTTVISNAPVVLQDPLIFSGSLMKFIFTGALGTVLGAYADTVLYLLYVELVRKKAVLAIEPANL